MKIFADTADVADIRRLASMGLVDGVTTNPSLVAKTGRDYADVVKEICALVDGPISAEVITTEAGAMIEEGLRLAAIHPNVVVKTPMGTEGLKACRELSRRNGTGRSASDDGHVPRSPGKVLCTNLPGSHAGHPDEAQPADNSSLSAREKSLR